MGEMIHQVDIIMLWRTLVIYIQPFLRIISRAAANANFRFLYKFPKQRKG